MNSSKISDVNKNTRFSSFQTFIKRAFFLDSSISARRKTFNSIWAIIFGLLVSCLFLSVYKLNPFVFVKNMFQWGATQDKKMLSYFIIVYGIASIGVGFSFKSGLFNIGISGQMMFAGIVGTIMLQYLIPKGSASLPASQWGFGFLIMFVCIICGFTLAAIAGFFKSFFKIHEVVSTILINWIVVYIGKYFFETANMPHSNLYNGSAILSFEGFFNQNVFWKFGLFLLIAIAVSLFIVFKYTPLGYKIKMNGINKNASSYSGVNQHVTTIFSMGFSGALAGLAGFIYFLIKENHYDSRTLWQPLLLGFDTIAISLLGQNSPIGIVFSSIFYSILQNSTPAIKSNYWFSAVTHGGLVVVVGIIIYFAAISNSFSQFRPLYKLFYWFGSFRQKHFREERLRVIKEFKAKQKELLEKIKIAKANQDNYKETYKKLLRQIKALEKESLVKVGSSNNSSSKEIEQIFAKASLEKNKLNAQLAQLGFYEVKDLKSILYSEKEQMKNKIRKLQNIAFDKYIFYIKETSIFKTNRNEYFKDKIEKHFAKEEIFLKHELEQKSIDFDTYSSNVGKNNMLKEKLLKICVKHKPEWYKEFKTSFFKDKNQELFVSYYQQKQQIIGIVEVE